MATPGNASTISSVIKTAMPWKRHFTETIQLTIPLVIGQVAIIAIWTVDIMMMGWISTEALAAGTLGNRLYQPFYFFAIGLTIAVSPLVSQALGGGRRRIARRVFRQGMWIAAAMGLITMLPMWHGRVLLELLGQNATAASDAEPFLHMLAPGMIPTFVYFVMRNYASAYKRPLPPVLINLAGVGINALLNTWFAYGGFGVAPMGLAGIGLATSLTFTLMMLVLGLYIQLRPPFRFTRPFARLYRLDAAIILRLLAVGGPIGILLLAETGMFIAAGFIVGLFGTIPLAAMGIANQIAAVTYMVPLAVSQASTIRVGHHAGAGERIAVIRAGAAAVLLVVLAALLLTMLVLAVPEMLIMLFLNPDDPQLEAVIRVALPMMMIVAILQLADGLQSVFTSILRGINDTRMPALLSLLCYWGVGIGSGIMLAFPLGLGPIGVWHGLLAGLCLASLLLGWRCLVFRRHLLAGGPILQG